MESTTIRVQRTHKPAIRLADEKYLIWADNRWHFSVTAPADCADVQTVFQSGDGLLFAHTESDDVWFADYDGELVCLGQRLLAGHDLYITA